MLCLYYSWWDGTDRTGDGACLAWRFQCWGLTAIAPFASTQVYLHQLPPANDDGAS